MYFGWYLRIFIGFRFIKHNNNHSSWHFKGQLKVIGRRKYCELLTSIGVMDLILRCDFVYVSLSFDVVVIIPPQYRVFSVVLFSLGCGMLATLARGHSIEAAAACLGRLLCRETAKQRQAELYISRQRNGRAGFCENSVPVMFIFPIYETWLCYLCAAALFLCPVYLVYVHAPLNETVNFHIFCTLSGFINDRKSP